MKTLYISFVFLFVFGGWVDGFGQCKPTFSQPTNSICKGGSLNFTITNYNNTFTYEWFRDGTSIGTTTNSTRTIPFNSSGTIEVKLKADDGMGCIDSTTKNITVHTLPTADFTFSPNNSCAPVNVSFSNASTGNGTLIYSWTNGGTVFSTSINPSRTFDVIGNGTQNNNIQLVVVDGNGCQNSIQKQVGVKRRPDARIGDSTPFEPDFIRCSNASSFTITVDDSSTTSNSNYKIDWGDGSSILNTNTSPTGTVHTYSNLIGYDTLKLTVTGTNGCISEREYFVFNGTSPAASLQKPSLPSIMCADFAVDFPIDTNVTNQNTDGTIYIISFDDGTPDDYLEHPLTQTYYRHIFRISSCGNTAIYGGQNDAFSIRMTAYNACSNGTNDAAPIRIGHPPVADFTINSSPSCEGTPITFINSSDSAIFNNNGNCFTGEFKNWSISPMTGVTINSPTNDGETFNATFSIAGTYNVTLIAWNSCGAGLGDTITKQVCIVPAPIANFDVGTNSDGDTVGCAPFTISTLANTSNIVSGVCSEIYSWSINAVSGNCANSTNLPYSYQNNTTSTSKNPEITFTEPGEYKLSLTIDNECAGSSTFERTIIVKDKPQFTLAGIPNFCLNAEINPIPASASSCYGTNTWSWTTTGGGSIEFPNQEIPGDISFSTTGNKSLTVLATNECGQADITRSFIINPLPTLPSISTIEPCEGQTLSLTPSGGSNNVNYLWTYPSGTTNNNSTIIRPNANLSMEGYYLLRTTLNDGTNCFDTTSVYVDVDTLPTINLTADDPTPCDGTPITITATGADNYTWQHDNSTNNPLIITPPNDTIYTVTGIDGNGCSSTSNIFIDVLELPTVTVAAAPTPICVSNSSTLTGSPSSGTWSGTGVVGNTFAPTNSGTFTLNYSYTDNFGCENNVDTTICVEPQPTPSFTLDNQTGCAPLTVNTTNTSNTVSVCGEPTYTWSVTHNGSICTPNTGQWNFDTGSSSSSESPMIVFQEPGNYTITLEVSNECGIQTFSDTVLVKGVPNLDIASIPAACGADTISPMATYSSCYDAITLYEWEFPNAFSANTVTGSNPGQVIYNTSGTFQITAKATNTCGVGTDVINFIVNPLPPTPNPTANTPCVGDNLVLNANTTGNIQIIQWIYPDGTVVYGASQTIPNAQLSDAGIYTLTVVDNNNCKTQTTLNVTINPLPNTNAGGDFSDCLNGSPRTLTGTPNSGGTGVWSSTSSGLSGNVFTPQAAGIGIHLLVYTFTDNNGCTKADTLAANIDSLPNIVVQADTTLCNQAVPTQLYANPSSGVWSGDAQVDSHGVFTPAQVGQVTLTYTYGDGTCQNADDVVVNVIDPPTITLDSDFSLCLGEDSLVFGTATPYDATLFRWEGAIESNGQFNADSVGVFIIKYLYHYGTCEVIDSLTITVHDLPTVTASPDTTLCADAANLPLNGTPLNGIWTGNGIVGNQFNPDAGSVIIGQNPLTYTFQDGNGCIDSAAITINVNALPIVTVEADTVELCNQNVPIQINGMPTTGGVWSGMNIDSSGIFTPNGEGNFTVTLTYNDGFCTNDSSLVVKVEAPETPEAGANQSACIDGDTLQMTGLPTAIGGQNGTWSGPFVTTDGIFSIDSIGTFTLYYTVGQNTCEVSDSVEVTVHDLPIVNAGDDAFICADGDSIVLSLQANVNPLPGIWTGNGITDTTTGVFKPDSTLIGNNIITYTYTDGNGCINTDEVIVTVGDLPDIVLQNDTTLCNQAIPTQIAAYTNGGSWSDANNYITSSGMFTPQDTGTFVVFYTLGNANCTNRDSITIMVEAPPTPEAGLDERICLDNGAIQLTGTPANYNNQNGFWQGGGVSSQGIFTPTVADTFITYYYVGIGTCRVFDSLTIIVDTLPVVDAGPDRVTCADGANITLSDSANLGLGIWVGNGIINDTLGIFNPDDTLEGTTVITYTFTDDNGCVDSDIVNILVDSLPTITLQQDTTLCNQPIATQLSATPINGFWTDANNSIDSSGRFTPQGEGNFTVYYTFGDANCVNQDSMVVTVDAAPTSEAGDDEQLCLNDSPIQLNGLPSNYNGENGYWTGTGVTDSGLFTPSLAGTFVLYYHVGIGTCKVMDSLTVVVHTLPVVDIGVDRVTCADGDTITLSDFANLNYGIWTGNGIADSTLGKFDPDSSNLGTNEITYIFADSNGCLGYDTLIVRVDSLPEIILPQDTSLCNQPVATQLFATPSNGFWTDAGNNVDSSGLFTPNGEGNFKVYYTLGDANCVNMDSMMVMVDPVPIPNAGDDERLCLNDSPIQLNGIPSNYNNENGYWTGINVTDSGLFTPSVTDTFILNYHVGLGTCKVEDSLMVIVDTLPVVDVGIDQTTCADGDTITLSDFTNLNYGIWTGNGIADSTLGKFDPDSSNLGTNEITYIFADSNGCLGYDTLIIRVDSLPEIILPQDTSLCNQPVATQLFATPSNGFWTDTGNYVDSSGLFTPNGEGNFKVYYTLGDANCVNMDSMMVMVDTVPIPNAGDDERLCLNDSPIQLHGIPSNYNSENSYWTGTNVTDSGLFTPSVTDTFILNYHVGLGTCKVEDSLMVIVDTLPVVDVGIDQTTCADGDTITLSDFTNLNYGIWTGNGIADSTLGKFDPDSSNLGTNEITYIFADSNGCLGYDTLMIRVDSLPDILLQNDTLLCNQNIGTQITAYTTGGNWSDVNGYIDSSGWFIPQATGNFVVIYTLGDANCINQDSITITVVPPPIPNAGNDTAICINTSPIQLIGTPVTENGVNGYWVGDHTSSTGLFTPDSVGVFEVVYWIGIGSCEVSDTIYITVNPRPIVDAGLSDVTCEDADTINLSGFSPLGGIWSGNGIVNSTGQFLASVAGQNPTPHILTYTFTDSNGCINNDTMSILVNPLPAIWLQEDTTLCNQAVPTQLYATPISNGWTGPHIDPNGWFTPNGQGAFTVTFTYGDGKCVNKDSIVVTVDPPPIIDAGPHDTLCIDQGLETLTNYVPVDSGYWTGSGIVDDSLGIFNPYVATDGVHTLTYNYGVGTCFVQDTMDIWVVDLTYVNPGVSDSMCLFDPGFFLTGFSPTGGIWTGNGITNPIGYFDPDTSGVGVHTLTYIYTEPISGCVIDTSKTQTVFEMPHPVFDIDTILCRDIAYAINNLSTNAVQWNWNFGDNSTSNLQNPTHTYTATGYYTIQLITTSIHGCIDSTEMTVYVTEIPTPYFVKDTADGCAPLDVTFTDSSSGDFIVYAWDMGNDSLYSQANPPTQTYLQGTSDSTYFITLTTSNLCGDSIYLDSIITFPTPQIAFAPDVFSGCTPLTVDFLNNTLGNPDIFYWDYGNGLDTTYNTTTHSHTFYTDTLPTVYTIRLIAENECGLDTAYTTITVNPVTVESFFNVDTTVGCAPLTINFTDYSTPGTTIVYDFGDGGSGTTGDTIYTFTQAGQYKAIQYVTNGCGYDSTFVIINVLPSPTATFTSVASECEDLPVVFTNTSQNTTGQLWNFGDGNTSTTSPISHTFDTAGTYAVTLTVYADTSQCPASTTQNITILPKPIADFNIDNANVCLGIPISITDNSTGNIIGTTGDLGDGNFFGALPITHTYADSGVYIISYVVEDANTCVSDTTFQNVVIYPIPTSDFAYEILDSCLIPTAVAFTNLSQGAVSYMWNLDNGQNLSTTNTTVTYNFAGNYTVNLTATNAYGCQDSSQQNFELHIVPAANFTFSQIDDCEPSLVQFTNNSTNSNSYFWDLGNGDTSTLSSPQAIYNRGSYDITLIVGADSACFDTLSFTDLLTVHPTPMANFYWQDTMIDERFKGVVAFTNTSIGATQYLWDFDDNATSTDEHPVYYFRSNNVYNVVLLAENAFGCSDDTTVPVQPDIFGTLAIPNTVAPDFGVGEDAVFMPKGVGIKAGSFLIEVFDNAGERLWSCDELDEDGTPVCAWDGTYRGRVVPQGAYVWKVKAEFLNGRTVQRTGTVTVLR